MTGVSNRHGRAPPHKVGFSPTHNVRTPGPFSRQGTSGRADRPPRRFSGVIGDSGVQRWTLFTADRKTEELRTLEQRLTKLRESIAAANRRS
ncbi:hypothetical protein GCM10017600_27180 [Streptosporangium carneum]|uniref:Uncharacterized protein n=1 Tax=Streptosporangium carneum TaxID=47481 RepID=A0A9W6MCR8_9ACTN|nr:hypothetical protein GCM10017600_27180 [Streptosporangium carneum]